MKDYTPRDIRNIVLIGPGGSGKTSIVEAALRTAGLTNRLGTIEQGNTVSDFTQEEKERKSSISLSLMNIEHNGVKLNILDSPGYPDFVGEAISSLRVTDGAVVSMVAQESIGVALQQTMDMVGERAVLFVVNMMDKDNADFRKVLSELRSLFGNDVVPFALPLGEGASFKGILDVISGKAFEYGNDGKGSIVDTPSDISDWLSEVVEELTEVAADANDELTEKYLEQGELSSEDIAAGLVEGVRDGKIKPVIPVSATANIGLDFLMDVVSRYFPSPVDVGAIEGKNPSKDDEVITREPSTDAPFSALIFKTIAEQHLGNVSIFRVYSGKIKAGDDVRNPNRNSSERIAQVFTLNGKDKVELSSVVAGDIGATIKLKNSGTGDTLCAKDAPIILSGIDLPEPVIEEAVKASTRGAEGKIAEGLARLRDEDPTFFFEVDSELKQTIIYGQGSLQLELVVKRLKERFGVDVELTKPLIHYRETISKKAEAQGKYKKQTGGHGQYGDVHLRLEPLSPGEEFEFVDEITGGVVPGKFIPSVEKGVREAMDEGVIAGYKVVGVKCTLFYGSYHSVDSSDMAFKIAGAMGFRNAFLKAAPYLLEPIYEVELFVPDDYTGDVMGDISSRRGKIQGVEPVGGNFQRIKALVPQAELYRYSTVLRSITQGMGGYKRHLSHYEKMPVEIAKKIIEESERRKSESAG